ncbi:MAG: hypothetical protein ACRDR6_31495 [Pseudonocardiaceae bacterium]
MASRPAHAVELHTGQWQLPHGRGAHRVVPGPPATARAGPGVHCDPGFSWRQRARGPSKPSRAGAAVSKAKAATRSAQVPSPDTTTPALLRAAGPRTPH